jgi:ligand-binding sensor domain-containing protein
LPSETVFKTSKKNKYLYIATQKGMFVYDGYVFVENKDVKNAVKNFYNDKTGIYLQDHEKGLVYLKDIFSPADILQKVNYFDADPDNDHYENIFRDARGNVWCSDFHHIKYYNPIKKTMDSFTISDRNEQPEFIINYFPVGKNLIITTNVGVFYWDPTKNGLKKIREENINSAIDFGDKILMITTSGNLVEFSADNYKFHELGIKIPENRFVEQKIHLEEIITYDTKNVYEINLINHSKQIIFSSKSVINHISYDEENNFFWISTQEGLIKLSQDKGFIQTLNPVKEKNISISQISEDDFGTLWIGDNQGNIIKMKNDIYEKELKIPEKTEQISCNNDVILIAAETGIYKINAKDENAGISKIISTKNPRKAVIYQDKIWVFSQTEKIQVYDSGTFAEIKNFVKNDENFYQSFLFNDAIVNDNKLWMASWMPKDYGISYFDDKTQKFIQISKQNAGEKFVGDYFNRIFPCNKNELLFSALGGYNTISQNGNIIGGIFTGKYPNIACNNMQGIAKDKFGNIWFGCEEGIYRYNGRKNEMSRISQRDGLLSNNITTGFCMASNGELYFSMGKNIQKINLEHLHKAKIFSQLRLTAIRLNNSIWKKPASEIEVHENKTHQIDIFFSVFNFAEKDKIKYRYRFDDEKWNDLGNEPKLSLIKINPGNYDITIEATDNINGNSLKTISLKLLVIPVFYKTLWFQILIILFIAAIIFFINRYLVYQEKQKGILKKNIQKNENKLLRSQMNPHFLFNSLNSINSFIIQNKKEDASNYLTSFSKLMRKILDNSGKDTITLKEELDTVKLYLDLETARLENKFDYSITIDENIDPTDVMIPPLILQPFLENAIWHGINPKKENGFIEISIKMLDQNTLNIEIKDDGIGRKAAAANRKTQNLHKSKGMNITMERIKMNNRENTAEIIDLYDHNQQSAGTLVNIQIDCNEKE